MDKALPKTAGSLHLEFQRCGRPNCRCGRGLLHGPYLVRRWREAGRQRKAYVPMKRLGEVVLEMERQRATAIRPMEVVRVLKELKMPKPALAKPPAEERKEIDTAEAFERRVAAENNSQFQELRDQAKATIAAVKGSRAIRGPNGWEAIFQKAKIGYQSGRFLIEQLGAERYLEPELMATLAQLRRDLLAGIENTTAADTMSADIAIIAYRNLLRVQGWIGSLCLTVERELFGQAPLNEIHGPTVGKELEQQLRRIEEHLLLLERCHRMMTRSFTHLEARRSKSAPSASVVVGQAGQVNVDCAVINEVGS